MDILGDQVHPVVQILFPNNYAIFQDDNLPKHTSRIVQAWFEEHEDALRHLPWPAWPGHFTTLWKSQSTSTPSGRLA
jgi:hypothetical protein